MTRILRIVITPAITLRAHNLSTMKLQSIRLKVNEMRTLSRMCLNNEVINHTLIPNGTTEVPLLAMVSRRITEFVWTCRY